MAALEVLQADVTTLDVDAIGTARLLDGNGDGREGGRRSAG